MSEYKGDACSVENQKILSTLVEREVVQRASVMVSALDKIEGLDPETEQAIIDLGSRYVDNTEAIEELEDERDFRELFDFTTTDEDEYEQLGCKIKELEDEQDNPRDALEHWIVSESLGLKLGQRGETVRELFDFTIWGRTTSGQSISIDSVIVEIALEMEILTGQKYDWSK